MEMKKETELFESLKKLNKRLTLLEDCVSVLEQRVSTVEDLNRLTEKKISKSFQEINANRNEIKDLKVGLNNFLHDFNSEPEGNLS